jgi:hypothetical protein
MEYSKVIPCERCEEEKRELEEVGIWLVLGCEPIADKEGWCRIRYTRK